MHWPHTLLDYVLHLLMLTTSACPTQTPVIKSCCDQEPQTSLWLALPWHCLLQQTIVYSAHLENVKLFRQTFASHIQYLEEVSQLPPAILWASSTEQLMQHQPLSNHGTYNPKYSWQHLLYSKCAAGWGRQWWRSQKCHFSGPAGHLLLAGPSVVTTQ